RPRRRPVAAPRAAALVRDGVQLALAVVRRAGELEREDHVQERRAAEAESGSAVDVRAPKPGETLGQRRGRELEMASGLDIAAGADIDLNHNPPCGAR